MDLARCGFGARERGEPRTIQRFASAGTWRWPWRAAGALCLAIAAVPVMAAEVERVEIVSTPERAGTYAVGQRILIDVVFDETVVVEGDPTLKLTVGETAVTALFDAAASTGARVRFGYAVVDGDSDTNGVSIAAQSLLGGTVYDLNDVVADVMLAALPHQAGHLVDGVVVAATVAVVSNAGQDDVYSVGEVIELTVSFNEDVRVEGTPLLAILFGPASSLKVPRHASLVRQTATGLRFAYEVQAGDLDPDGISVTEDSLEGGAVEDIAGNRMRAGVLLDSASHTVDGIEPELSSIRVTSDPGADATYGLGDAIELSVTFSEVVFGTDLDTLGLLLEIGGRSRVASLVDGSGTLTLRFRYTVLEQDRDEDGISVPPRALRCGDPANCVRDLAGNQLARPFIGIPAQSRHRVDGTAPPRTGVDAVAITSSAGAGGTYGLGDVIEVTVEFSDAVHVTGSAVVTLSVGANSRAAAFAAGSGTPDLVFRYVVQEGDLDEDGISIAADALTGGLIEDDDGNRADRTFGALGPQSAHRVDGAAPPRTRVDAVVMTSDAGADGTYRQGDVIEATVEFTDAVHVTGSPVVTLSVGANSRAAAFAAGSGTPHLVFRYAVQDGDLDEDGISIAANALTGGSVTDANGNPADRAFTALAPQPAHRVDGVGPERTGVDGVGITSDAGADGIYGSGDMIEVTVEFSDAVHVTGDPVVTLSVGANSRPAAFVAGSGTPRLAFRYMVQDGDSDEDGISIGPDALTGGVIQSAGGGEVDRAFAALAPLDAHRVDALPPTLVAVAITSDAGPDGAYGPGDVAEVTVQFSDVVHVTGTPVLTLSVGANSQPAAFATGSGTPRLVFRYTVQHGDSDEDGISIGADALTGGAIEDANGNPANRMFAALGPQPAHRVDAVRTTTVDTVAITSNAGPEGTYGHGDSVEVTVVFSDAVHVTGDPVVTLSVGASSRRAAYATGSGTPRLVFRYTVQDGDSDEDGVSIAADALTGGAIEDAAGNPADRSFAALRPQRSHRVDALPTAVAGVAITSDAGEDGTYDRGDVVEATIEFADPVYVTGEPVLVLSVGANSREAAYATGSGTPRLVFRYTVQDGDSDEDGISIAADALTGGAIEDAAGNPADRSFEALAPQRSHRVDALPTAVTGVAITSDAGEDGTYDSGDVVEATIEFADPVYVTGEPVLVLSVGANSREAAYATGSGTPRLVFRYTVQDGDSDEDGISIAADALTGGAIEDAAGNPADRSFEALAPQRSHRVDALPTAVTGVAITSNAGEDGTYEPGDVVEATVEFTDPVYVTGEPVLVLSIGANSREAAYATGSGTRRLAFRYTVQDGDSDEDGISIAADALTGGAVEDAGGNPADRCFDALAPQSAHRVAAPVELALAPVTVSLGSEERLDLTETLAQAGISYDDTFNAQSGDPGVVEARTAGGALVLTPVAEGTALVTVTARRAPITLVVPVQVTASAEERAMLESALAAVGRGLLSSATMTIGARLELGGANSSPTGGLASLATPGDRMPSMEAADAWLGGGRGVSPRASGFGEFTGQSLAGTMPSEYRGHFGGTMSSAAMGGALRNRASSWAVWGAADAQSFEGEPDNGTYDGTLASIYLGADVRGDGWVAGGSVSRSTADVSYDVARGPTGSGTLEIEMNAVYPYVQWTPAPRATLWSIVGFGTGDATQIRDGAERSGEPGHLSMRMGIAGLNVGLGELGGVSLAVRGDAGIAELETDDGLRAVQGLGVAVQRLRLGMEFAMPLAAGDRAVLTPFLDVGGRWDGGDGQTGGGVEVAGGLRYRAPVGGVEVKARSLAAHGAQGVSETAVAATFFVEPGANAGGLRLSLTPRWGDAESRDALWRPDYALRLMAHGSRGPEWGLKGRIGYGFNGHEDALVTPFAEYVARYGESRARMGLSYRRDGPMHIDLIGERLVRMGHGAEGGVLVRLVARR